MLIQEIRVFASLVMFSVAAVLSAPTTATGEQTLEVAVPFTNNMILQRQVEVPVWGFDLPGTKVTVEFAGQQKSTITNQQGDWMVRLDPLTASRVRVSGRSLVFIRPVQHGVDRWQQHVSGNCK